MRPRARRIGHIERRDDSFRQVPNEGRDDEEAQRKRRRPPGGGERDRKVPGEHQDFLRRRPARTSNQTARNAGSAKPAMLNQSSRDQRFIGAMSSVSSQ